MRMVAKDFQLLVSSGRLRFSALCVALATLGLMSQAQRQVQGQVANAATTAHPLTQTCPPLVLPPASNLPAFILSTSKPAFLVRSYESVPHAATRLRFTRASAWTMGHRQWARPRRL